MFKKQDLANLIKKTAKEWVFDEKDYVCYWDVNSGSCGEFAVSVIEKLPPDSGVVATSTGQFLEEKGLESYGENGEFSNHVWLLFNGEHFDLERPEGVKIFTDLPYFQREMKARELGIRDHKLFQLTDENPEAYENLIYIPK